MRTYIRTVNFLNLITMKKTGTLLLMAFLTISMVPSCLGEDILDPDQPSSSDSSSKSVSDVDPDNDEDLVSGFTPDYTVTVTYSTGGAVISGDVDMVTSVVDGCDVTITNPGDYGIKYILTGTSQDGFFKLYSTHKQEIELSSLNLRNPDGAAINNQSKKRTYVVLAGASEISDGTSYSDAVDDEDMKAAFFSEGQLCFSGDGSLKVTAVGNRAIASDDYVRLLSGTVTAVSSANHAVRGSDAVIITDGTLTASASASTSKAVSTDGIYYQAGGTVTLTSTGSAAYDSDADDGVSGTACIKADGDLTIKGGVLTCTSTGTGGKGMSIGGNAAFEGGTVTVSAKGGNFGTSLYHSYAKGVKVEGNITVSDGSLTVSSAYHEGLTNGSYSDRVITKYTQTGGVVMVTAADDAVNSSGVLTVSGGALYGLSTRNDGIDANAAMSVTGGVVIGCGSSGAECGIDTIEGSYLTIDGGYVISVGGSVNPTNSKNSKAFVTTSLSRGTKIAVYDGETPLFAFQVPSTGGTAALMSAPSMKSGSSYKLYTGVSFTPSYFGCFGTEGISGGKESDKALTASSSVSQGMGGGPGRRW